MKRLSLEEFAKKLGVSKTLVSLVLNGKGDKHGIKKATQKLVLEKAAELNYRPNLIARGLRTGRSNVLGLIVADISNTFYATISRSIEAEARKLGYQMMVCSTEEIGKNEEQLIEMLIGEQNASGVIIATTQQDPEKFKVLQERGTPLVLIDRVIPKLNVDSVTVDNYKGAFEATEHLLNIGYKRIGLFSISPDFLSSISDRKKGYRDALKKHDIRFNPSLVHEIPFDNIRESVFKELKELVRPPHGIDALFTLNNNIAAYALEFLNEAGLRIPRDVAVISFDDVDYFRFVTPPVTAVAQPIQEIGKKAVMLLNEQISGERKRKVPRNIVLPVEMIVRKSCGAFLKNV